jgi:hypothetical protein
MNVIEPGPEWTKVSLGPDTGYVATAYLQKVGGGQVAPPTPSSSDGFGGVVSAIADQATNAIGSLVDGVGNVVGTMFGGHNSGTPVKPIANGTSAYEVIPAPDGMGEASSPDSDRTWMENMIGPGHAAVSVDYKQPVTWNVDYSYQNGHGADGTTHAAYDITCDDPNGACVGTPINAPMSGKVVCAGYESGTGEAVGSPNCGYSKYTTVPGSAHTIVVEVGRDANGNPIQLSFNHMGTSEVEAGQMINEGDPIGTMGDTDAGPHVHLEGWIGDAATGYQIVDPQLIVGGYYSG